VKSCIRCRRKPSFRWIIMYTKSLYKSTQFHFDLTIALLLGNEGLIRMTLLNVVRACDDVISASLCNPWHCCFLPFYWLFACFFLFFHHSCDKVVKTCTMHSDFPVFLFDVCKKNMVLLTYSFHSRSDFQPRCRNWISEFHFHFQPNFPSVIRNFDIRLWTKNVT